MKTPETIHFGSCACGQYGQLFLSGKCAHCYIAELEANRQPTDAGVSELLPQIVGLARDLKTGRIIAAQIEHGGETVLLVAPGGPERSSDLKALSDAATPGPISLNPQNRLRVRTSMDHPMCEFSEPQHRLSASGEGADPEFMVALWNAYRAGDLVHRSEASARFGGGQDPARKL